MADGMLIFDTLLDTSGLTNGVGGVGKSMKNVYAEIAKAIFDFGKESVALSSNLQEIQNVVDVTFGDSKGVIDEWSKTIKTGFGLSEMQGKQYAGVFGSMLKSMSVSSEKIPEMSMRMAELVGSVASFYNLDHETAFQKIRSGLSGETEPLKALGINMSVANMNAFALSNGIEKTYEKMTQAEKASLAYTYMMFAASDANGDFARSIDSVANQSRLLETNWNEMKTNVGNVLLPAASSVLGVVNSLFALGKQEISLFDVMSTSLAVNASELDQQKNAYELNCQQALALLAVVDELNEKENLSAGEHLQLKAAMSEAAKMFPQLLSLQNAQGTAFENGTDTARAYIRSLTDEKKAQLEAGGTEEKRKTILDTLVSAQARYQNSLVTLKKAQAEYAFAVENTPDIVAVFNETVRKMDEIGLKDGRGFSFGVNLDALRLRALTGDESLYSMFIGEMSEADQKKFGGVLSEMSLQFEQQKKLFMQSNQGYEAAQKVAQAYRDVAQAEKDLSEVSAYADVFGITAQSAKTLENALPSTREELEATIESMTDKSKTLTEQIEALGSGLYELSAEKFSEGMKRIQGQFGLFDMPQKVAKGNLSKDTQSMEEQAKYWERYKTALETLEEREGGAAWVNLLADGSEESLSQLEALATASDEDYQKANDAQSKLLSAQQTVAQSIAESLASVDTLYQSLQEQLTAAQTDLTATESAIDSAQTKLGTLGETEAAPVATLTDEASAGIASIRQELNRLDGSMATVYIRTVELGSKSGGNKIINNRVALPYKSGLEYVPYDEFPAILHEGEAVLTKKEAVLWRAGYLATGGTIGGGRSAGAAAVPGVSHQTINFNVPVQTPDEFAQTMRLYSTYGLEGVFC